MPCRDPRASGKFGVRSPSKYGSRVRPPEPGGALRASRANASMSTPSNSAVLVNTRAAFRVHTRGRKRPLASANPATSPDGSDDGESDPANAVPEVPRDTTTSPGPMSSDKAAPMLSPVPGPNTTGASPVMPSSARASPPISPTASDGPATRGSRAS